MSCYHPLRAFRSSEGVVIVDRVRGGSAIFNLELPCGICIGCRMRRASDWELRVMHEASFYDANCFVTLTYGEGKLPQFGSLSHRDFQLFMKRLRKHFGVSVRFYMCGEYGDKHQRPHYHACLFNVDFRSDRVPAGKSGSGAIFYKSMLLESLWTHGICSVQDLTRETASYCARYVMKKALGPSAKDAYKFTDLETGEIIQLVPEYAKMSLKPGIGRKWIDRYEDSVFPRDSVVSVGKERQVPRYYDRVIAKRSPSKFEKVQVARVARAKDSRPDNTDARRSVREKVHLARVRVYERNLE